MSIRIRQLTAADAADYRAIRLHALETDPHAFGASLEEDRARGPADWQALLSNPVSRVFYGAVVEDRLVGTVNVMRETGIKTSHKSRLLGMYVHSDMRRNHAGRLLVSAAIDAARRQSALQIHLGVGSKNTAAKRLYESFGFVAYGTEPRALRVGAAFVDEIHMVKKLDDE